MTVEDFLKLVKSIYGDDLDLLSPDELFEIACAYKLFVPAEEKRLTSKLDWNTFAWKYGICSTGKSAAEKVRHYLNKHPEFVNYLNNKFFSKTTEQVKKVYEPFNIESYKEKTQLKDLLNEYRRLVREDARIDDLKETIREAAKSVDTYFSEYIINYANRNPIKEAILLLSDWHIGVIVDNFYNKYNFEIAKNELDLLVKSVIDYCDKFNIYRLNIINMGDLIHGGIHTNARIEQEFDVITQIELAGQLLYRTLAKLEPAAPEVTYRSCSDNHSRLMPNKSEHIEKENFGRLIDWWVEAKLEQGNHSIKIIKDNIDFGLGKFELMNGKKIMFAHGHEDPINQAYQNFTGATREFIDYILLAHFHNPKEKAFQDCRVIVNGSLVGTEQYALSKRLFTTPCQKLLIFDDNFVDITIHTNICRD